VLIGAFERFHWLWIPVAAIALFHWWLKNKEAARVTESIEGVDAMGGTEFEHFLVKLFTALGYSATHTGKSGDFGADLILEGKDGRVAVQAKNYDTGNVGNDAVQ
ncbi:MAG: restriction endonuclease, partial [Deltaproteobacteria bacterium]|jgi:restriction system protein|nr:restriction endonuclease [Deltaproteobacteria bacterium]